MNPTRRIRALVAALAVGLIAPAVASAQPIDAETPRADNADGSSAKARKNRRWPMDGDEFTNRIDAGLARLGARLDKRLEQADVPEAVSSQIRADYQKGAAAVRAAAAKAAADGAVTMVEAREVRKVAREIKRKIEQQWTKKTK